MSKIFRKGLTRIMISIFFIDSRAIQKVIDSGRVSWKSSLKNLINLYKITLSSYTILTHMGIADNEKADFLAKSRTKIAVVDYLWCDVISAILCWIGRDNELDQEGLDISKNDLGISPIYKWRDKLLNIIRILTRIVVDCIIEHTLLNHLIWGRYLEFSITNTEDAESLNLKARQTL